MIEIWCVYKLVTIEFAEGILPWLWLSVISSILSKIYGHASVGAHTKLNLSNQSTPRFLTLQLFITESLNIPSDKSALSRPLKPKPKLNLVHGASINNIYTVVLAATEQTNAFGEQLRAVYSTTQPKIVCSR